MAQGIVEGVFKINSISIERKRLRNKMASNWKHNLKLKIENYIINLPAEIAVSPLKAWKINELKKTDLMTKLVMEDANNVAYIIGSALMTDNDIENALNNRKALTFKEKKAMLLKETTDTGNMEQMNKL